MSGADLVVSLDYVSQWSVTLYWAEPKPRLSRLLDDETSSVIGYLVLWQEEGSRRSVRVSGAGLVVSLDYVSQWSVTLYWAESKPRLSRLLDDETSSVIGYLVLWQEEGSRRSVRVSGAGLVVSLDYVSQWSVTLYWAEPKPRLGRLLDDETSSVIGYLVLWQEEGSRRSVRVSGAGLVVSLDYVSQWSVTLYWAEPKPRLGRLLDDETSSVIGYLVLWQEEGSRRSVRVSGAGLVVSLDYVSQWSVTLYWAEPKPRLGRLLDDETSSVIGYLVLWQEE